MSVVHFHKLAVGVGDIRKAFNEAVSDGVPGRIQFYEVKGDR